MKLRWTQSAQADLAQIQGFIARDSVAYSESVIDRVIGRAEGLTAFPESGQIVAEYQREDIREVFVHSFRLIYLISPGEISVLTVIHGARLLPDTPPDTT